MCDIVKILPLLLDLCHLFVVLLNVLISCFKILQHKKIEQQYIVIISLYWAQASEPQVDLRNRLIVVS